MSVASLDREHLTSFGQAMTNILSTPLAEFTYAQLVDGMPTSLNYRRDRYIYYHEGAPAMDHHELCPDSMEKTRDFLSRLHAASFKFGPKTIKAYQNTPPGSVAFKLRLLELVVIACHDLAVFLHKLDDGAHKHSEWQAWHAEKLDSLPETEHYRLGLPTPFYRCDYAFWPGYPNGWADVAGYWAENHIFGGVVLFDRGQSEEDCNGLYLHNPDRAFTLAPPTEAQFNNLVEFLLSPTRDPESPSPLPISITQENKWRWHPYDGMVEYNIFKFRHELPHGPRIRDHCVITPVDWPEYIDQDRIENELVKQLEGEHPDEDLIKACRERLKRTVTPTSRCYHWNEEEQSKLQPDPKKRGRPPYFFDP